LSKFAEFAPGARAGPRLGAPEGLVIRPGRPADLPALAAIAAEREGEPTADWQARFERIFATTAAGDSCLFVAALGETMVGYGKCAYFSPPTDSPPNVAPAGFYLTGVVVDPAFRRRGLGLELTRARLEWIRERGPIAYYFANERNRVTIELHRALGFVELTRDFSHPHVRFEGGAGIFFGCDLRPGSPP
jgi:ribosomal protein S18 acetylase RimI-like enzyme